MLYDSRDTYLSAVFLIHTSIGSALSDNYIVLPGCLAWRDFCITRTATTFSDRDISKCLNILSLVVE